MSYTLIEIELEILYRNNRAITIEKMKKLTKQNLQSAFKDNKSYSLTQPFLSAFAAGQQQPIQIINHVFLETLSSEKISLMSKLLVLRMVKDLFITGNMEAFDKIDPEVEEIIISAAAYNPKFRSKGKNDKETRGGMYFIETEKRPKNTQNIQLGNSFVLLATQIIKNFALWLPRTLDGQPSRFQQAQKELEDLGVIFENNIYFQPQEAKKFKKNYEAWVKSQQNKGEKEQVEEKLPQQPQSKNEKEKIDDQSQINSIQIQKMKQQNEKLSETLKQKAIQLVQVQQKLSIQEKNYLEEKQGMQKEIQSLKQSLSKHEEINQGLNKKIRQMESQQNDDQIRRIAKLNQEKSMLEAQLVKINEVKNDALQRNLNLQILTQELKTQCSNLNQELQKRKLEYQTSFAQKNINEVQAQHQAHRLRQSQEKEIFQLRTKLSESQKQKVQLFERIELLNKTISQLRTLKEEAQIKVKDRGQKINSNQMLKLPQEQVRYSIKDQIKEMPRSSSKNLASFNLNQPIKDTKNYEGLQRTGFVLQNKRSSSSLHKTQSSKFRHNRRTENQGSFHNKQNSWTQKAEASLLEKSGYSKVKNVITSVFPYLPQYFPPISVQCQHFGACALQFEKKYSTFYKNEVLQLRLLKPKENPNNFQIGIKNRTPDSLTIQVSALTDQVRVRQQFSLIKINSLNQIKINVDSFVTDLNFRLPGLNIAVEAKKEKRMVFRVPTPITLFSFTSLSQSLKILQRFDRFDQSCYKKHRSQKIIVNSQIHSLIQAFPQINFYRSSDGGYSAKAIMTYPNLPEVELRLNMVSNQRCCEFETQFLAQSKISEAFSKVILQVLMFIFR